METLNIEKEKAINAYRVGSDEQKQVLELLFGVETLKPKTVMDRVKTFEDALKELKPFHPLVKEYKALRKADVTPNLIAYSKLCIVTAALNEGWTPYFIKGEKRHSPCFFLYTDKEIRNMSKEEKSSVVYQSCDYAHITSHIRRKSHIVATILLAHILYAHDNHNTHFIS